MTSGPTIDYEALQQEAMRNVVRSVLKETERSGLPGDHHFYISFNTRAPGVILSRRLKEKYPHEMTIVLQHRFWGLVVTEERFEVNLTFDGIPERLVIPFQSIRVFVDPSVRFGLQFETADIGPDIAPAHASGASPQQASTDTAADSMEADIRPAAPTTRKRAPKKSKPSERPAAERTRREAAPPEAAPEPAAEEAPQAAGGPANVVSLDAFRKR
ncbi:MAG: hypothetical protein KDJ47_11575 [Hyphomicrobiaceae bacterium]|nr:hypothetical protein [Hyphomicrobiaceae bacterium]